MDDGMRGWLDRRRFDGRRPDRRHGHTSSARLEPGEAYLYTEGYHGPQRIRTPNLAASLNLGEPPAREALAAHLAHEPWLINAAAIRTDDELGRLRLAMDRLEKDQQDVRDQLLKIDAERIAIVSRSDNRSRAKQMAGLRQRVRNLRKQLRSSLTCYPRMKTTRLSRMTRFRVLG